jgi:hypothetical protein
VAAAVRQRWLEVSERKESEGLEKRKEERAERFFLEIIIWSKSWMAGSSPLWSSRSWMNSWKARVG